MEETEDHGRILGRLEAKMDTVLEKLPELDKRITGLEKTKWFGHGIVATISAIVTTGLGFVIHGHK